LDAITLHLEAVADGRIRRLVITTPPNTLKSTVVSVCWPAWVWTRDPATRFLCAANDGPLAVRDALAMRTLVESPWYAGAFGSGWGTSPDQDCKSWFNNDRGGHRISYSVNARVTGKKGDVLLLDDPNDARKVWSEADRLAVIDWYTSAFSNRVADEKTSPVVVVGQRTHPNDLIGHLLGKGGWVELRLPERFDTSRKTVTPIGWSDPRSAAGEWLRPGRFAEAEEAERVRDLGPLGYQGQHLQDPQHRGGSMFPRAKANLVNAVPADTVAVRYWDTAATVGETSCFTSGVLMGRTPAGRFVVIDLIRDRLKPAERNALIRQTALLDLRRVGIDFRRTYFEQEPGGAGVEAAGLLMRELAGLSAAPDRVTGPKQVRAEPLSSQWEAGNVDVVLAGWTAGYLERMEAFPAAADKDDADASSGAFNKLCHVPDGGIAPDVVQHPPPAQSWHHPGEGMFSRDWAAEAGLFGMGR
jgi:predicted phage terminase large subunit-like protein